MSGNIVFWAWGGEGGVFVLLEGSDVFVFLPPKKEERPGVPAAHIVEHAAPPGRQAGVW